MPKILFFVAWWIFTILTVYQVNAFIISRTCLRFVFHSPEKVSQGSVMPEDHHTQGTQVSTVPSDIDTIEDAAALWLNTDREEDHKPDGSETTSSRAPVGEEAISTETTALEATTPYLCNTQPGTEPVTITTTAQPMATANTDATTPVPLQQSKRDLSKVTRPKDFQNLLESGYDKSETCCRLLFPIFLPTSSINKKQLCFKQ